MLHSTTPRPWYAAIVALALAAAPAAAQQGSAPAPAAAVPAASPVPDSAKPAAGKSRFGRFGRMFGKAAGAAQNAAASAGISKETAARLAITAATGGAAAAVLSAREQSATSAATLASRALTSRPTAHVGRGTATLATGSRVDTATTAAAMRAMTELGQISARAQQHDPAAMHALQVLSAVMAKPDAEFVALQRRATAGDPTAAQQMMIREGEIARAALASEGSRP